MTSTVTTYSPSAGVANAKSPQQDAICLSPNQHAKPLGFTLGPLYANVTGYQDFTLTKHSLVLPNTENPTAKKAKILAPVLSAENLQKRTVLDLGSNNGFFGFTCLQQGASQVTAVDMDPEVVKALRAIGSHLELNTFDVVESNVESFEKQGDVVLALALIHWIYSCTACYGSLDGAIAKLASMTNYMLVIEWVAPEDSAIAFFNHLNWNASTQREPYTLQNFLAALKSRFGRVEKLGDVNATRSLWVAFKGAGPVDLACPLPPLYADKEPILARKLTTHLGADFWSRVYDCGDRIVKQASTDLAYREKLVMEKLTTPHFPRVLSAAQKDGYSVVEVEKVQGRLLSQIDPVAEFPDAQKFGAFVRECTQLLCELQQAGVQHRDINAGNIILRDGTPVLIDYGWSTSETTPYILPSGVETPSDRQPCDVFSMGALLKELADFRFAEFAPLFQLMTHEDVSTRVTDARMLVAMADAICAPQPSAEQQAMIKLLQSSGKMSAHFDMMHQRVATLEAEVDRLQNLLKEADRIQQQYIDCHTRFTDMSNSRAWKLANGMQELKAKLRGSRP